MPRVLGPIPADRWERVVRDELRKQLPADWVVICNVTWVSGEGRYVQEGQADFVVLVPNSGMVILEVKGSREIWIDSDGCWYRSDISGDKILIPKSPPEQAMSNMHKLAKIVEEKGGWAKFPGRYSWIVAYPNGKANQVPVMFDSSTLITSRHMHELASSLRLSLEKRGPEAVATHFSGSTIDKIAEILTSQPFAVSKVDSGIDVRDDVLKIDTLVRQQFAALRGVFEFPRVAVVGPAGSGKTLLAIWRLQALLEDGKKAMYVCFNSKLAESLKSRNPDYAEAITNVDKLFAGLCPTARSSGDSSVYFRETLPALALAVAETIEDHAKYDAIIVDEGQDFNEDRLYVLYELLKNKGSDWIFFSDRRQDLFQSGSGEAFGADVVFQLHHNCRNTQRVNRATNQYLGSSPIQSMPGMPEGELPNVLYCSSKESMATRAWELASQWSSEQGLVILSPYTLSNSCMSNCTKGHSLTLTENLNDLGKKGFVYFSTIRSFKGIEAPVIILVDAGIPSENDKSVFRNQDLYVACTRPTARLAILTNDKDSFDWFSQRQKAIGG
jgi:thymidine kinase